MLLPVGLAAFLLDGFLDNEFSDESSIMIPT
jgi:hypothetical protein